MKKKKQITPSTDNTPPPIEKPPYRVPSMAEIRAIPWNGYNVVSTFSGAGGSSLGYRMAGYHVLWANEFIPAAQASYKANHPDSILDVRDIRKVQPNEILAAIGLDIGDIDIFDGSPPCSSFSLAGKRESGWGKEKEYSDTTQRTDDLFFEYCRLLAGLQPKVFVAENVSGLVKGTAKGYFLDILKALKGCGYVVAAKVLDAQWLGVPQMRQRVIFIGVRQDLHDRYHVLPVHPTPLPYRYTVREALPWIIKNGAGKGFGKPFWASSASRPSGTIGASRSSGNGLSPAGSVYAIPREEEEQIVELEGANGYNAHANAPADQPAATIQATRPIHALYEKRAVQAIHDTGGTFSQGDITDRPCPSVTTGRGGDNSYHYQIMEEVHAVEPETNIEGYAIGKLWDEIEPGESHPQRFNLSKPDLSSPCPTITQTMGNSAGKVKYAAGVTHPLEKRYFSIEECKRICAFPDDFILLGTYAQQWERLGRAVPPLMMRAIAATIQTEMLDRMRGGT